MKSSTLPSVAVLAQTQLVNREGSVGSFDNLLDHSSLTTDALCLSKNRLSETYLTDLDSFLDTETGEVVTIVFSTKEEFNCLVGSGLLKDNNFWVAAEELKEGDTLRAVLYNPAHRHPQQVVKQIASVSRTATPLIVAAEFIIQVDDNILAAIETDNKVLLLPLKPPTTKN